VYSVDRLGGLATVTADVDGTVYEVCEVTEPVAKKAMGQFDEPLVVFFAATVNLEGTATGFLTAGDVADRATPVFRDELARQGVEDVEEVEPRDPLPDVADGAVTEFRGTYEIQRIEREATRPGGGSFPIVVTSQSLETAAFQTVWKPDDGTALVAGGGYPNEDFESRESANVSGAEGDSIDVEVSIDLNLEPDAYRQRSISLVESVR